MKKALGVGGARPAPGRVSYALGSAMLVPETLGIAARALQVVAQPLSVGSTASDAAGWRAGFTV